MRRWLHEPLLHFLLAGAAVFAITAMSASPDEADESDVIVVDEVVRDGIEVALTESLGRDPTATELRAAEADWIAEEALYREARAMGLDRADLIVRRRLVQNLRFVLAGQRRPETPEEATLRAFYEAHPAAFVEATRTSFEHVFLREGDGETLGFRAGAALTALRAGAAYQELGDPFVHGVRFDGLSDSTLSQRFGPDFVSGLRETPIGTWEGPLVSAFGVHLVRVTERVPGGVPSYESVREDVRDAWYEAEQERLDAEALRIVVDRYDVVRD